MADLAFYDKGHIYMLDGERIPCVSDLCRFLHKEIYKDAPLWQLEAAADRGTAVHLATEQLDKTGRAEISDDYAPYLQAYAKFLQEHDVKWELIEKSDYHPDLMYAGTIDRYGTVDGLKMLVDLKTTYTVYKPLCGASLNLYWMMLESRGYDVQQLAILHLKKDGTYKFIKFDFDEDVPYALLLLHNITKKKTRNRRKIL